MIWAASAPLVWAVSTEDAVNEALGKHLDFSGYYRFELGYRYEEPRTFTKMRNTLNTSFSYSFSRKWKWKATSWLYYDVAYDLFDYETIAARFERDDKTPLVFVDRLAHEKDSPVAEFREFYTDILLTNVDLRLGLQHVLWGVLEGVRVVDEINPMNFRELILPDEILDYRIPLWTVKLDWYTGRGDWQFLLIPDLRFHEPAPRGSEWELFQKVPNTVYPQSGDMRNWETGLRWSNSIWNTDVSLSYFYTWDDFPSIFRHVTSLGSNPEPTLFPSYNRIHMFGTTFSRQMFGLILKGEAAFVTGKYFGIDQADENNDSFLDSAGELKKNHLRWGLGLDLHMGNWDFSPTYVQWKIYDYAPAILQNEHDDAFNLYARRKFQTGNATVTALWIYLIDMRESYVKPRVNFAITDRYHMSVGMDMFTGAKTSFGVGSRSSLGGGPLTIPETLEQRAQFFGNFNNNDRVVVEMQYTF